MNRAPSVPWQHWFAAALLIAALTLAPAGTVEAAALDFVEAEVEGVNGVEGVTRLDSEEDGLHDPPAVEGHSKPHSEADDCRAHTLADDQSHDALSLRAEGYSQADFSGSTRHCVRHHAV